MASRKVIALLVEQVAPPHPPCFADDAAWHNYLVGAVEEHRQGHAGAPLLTQHPPTFNYRLQFCADCTAQHSFRMAAAGKCKPDHILRLAAQPAPSPIAHVAATILTPPPAPSRRGDLPEWLPQPEWRAFVAMRERKGWTISDYARERLLEKLAQARSRGHDIAKMLRNAAERGLRSPADPDRA